MKSILTIGRNKAKCQKFTPTELVNIMLDLVGYNTDIMGRTILENSFGSGNILKVIVRRYIENAINEGKERREIAKGLSRDIYGVELDNALYSQCISDLNAMLKKYRVPAVKWNLYNEDALFLDFGINFDFIIGNPPYIAYREMDAESRKRIKEQFESCSEGKFDYCYAFIELSLRRLNNTGKLVQLVPNNIYKNVFAKKLRSFLLGHITTILDYPNQRLFDKTLTSVSIFLYDKADDSGDMYYENVTDGVKLRIDRQSLGDKWVFGSSKRNSENGLRFGDVFNASITIATLCNEAFIIDEQDMDEVDIEDSILKNAVSPKTLRLKRQRKIIFPYRYDAGILQHYSTFEFKNLFPNAYRYLQRFTQQLKKRNSDKTAAWFEYGRSQALANINTDKLLISTIITNTVEVYRVDADTIPYSGIYITVKDDNYSLDDAVKILKSDQFMQYIRNIGISISGKSLRITCKDINDYLI